MQECYLTKASFVSLNRCSDAVFWVSGVIVCSRRRKSEILAWNVGFLRPIRSYPQRTAALRVVGLPCFARAAGRALGCRYPRCHLSARIMSPHLRRQAGLQHAAESSSATLDCWSRGRQERRDSSKRANEDLSGFWSQCGGKNPDLISHFKCPKWGLR